jgi:hypothetical protein
MIENEFCKTSGKEQAITHFLNQGIQSSRLALRRFVPRPIIIQGASTMVDIHGKRPMRSFVLPAFPARLGHICPEKTSTMVDTGRRLKIKFAKRTQQCSVHADNDSDRHCGILREWN